MTEHLHVLLIEDDQDHEALIRAQLGGVKGAAISLQSADHLEAGLTRLNRGGIDAVLLDFHLPDSRGLDSVARLVADIPDMPIIVLTSLDDMETAVRSVQQGAQDYLVKSEINGPLLTRAIRYAVERKRAQTELERYAARLEHSSRDFQEFANIISHDLKTPLWVVGFSLELLQRKYHQQIDAETAEFVNSAVQAVRQMGRLIEDLTTFARAGTDHRPLASVDCDEVLRHAMACLQPTIAEEGMTLTCEPLPRVKGDAIQLTQLFQNLLGNAVKYRSERPLEVHVGVQSHGPECWRFHVRDNGIGINPADFERIFMIFERIVTDESRAGSGIGLAICKRIVDRHGGRMWVESEPGQGSTFYFTLQAAGDET